MDSEFSGSAISWCGLPSRNRKRIIIIIWTEFGLYFSHSTTSRWFWHEEIWSERWATVFRPCAKFQNERKLPFPFSPPCLESGNPHPPFFLYPFSLTTWGESSWPVCVQAQEGQLRQQTFTPLHSCSPQPSVVLDWRNVCNRIVQPAPKTFVPVVASHLYEDLPPLRTCVNFVANPLHQHH